MSLDPVEWAVMFEIQRELAETEVDETIFEKLAALRRYLLRSIADDFPIRIRYAPSIIVRSEAEMFGLSRPRFAIRAYLGPNCLVNMRRIQAMAATIKTHYPSSVAEQLSAEYRSAITGWIADSLLIPPETAGADDRPMIYLSADLWYAFGEPVEGTAAQKKQPIPFVTHLRVGGGMCAQAAAFMALTLAKARRIYGPSELTRLVFSKQDSIPLDGLTCDQLCDLLSLKEFETNAVCQVVHHRQTRILDVVLRAYIGSEIPVILLVALSRLAGKHDKCAQPIINRGDPLVSSLVSESHWTGVLAEYHINRNDHHCIVVVGMSQDTGDPCGPSLFSVQDPATLPFLPATAEQLLDARRYVGNSNAVLGGHRYEIEPPAEPLRFIELIPVTPQGVHNVLAPHARKYELAVSHEGETDTDSSIQELPLAQGKEIGSGSPEPEKDPLRFVGFLQIAETKVSDPRNGLGLHVRGFKLTGDEIRLMKRDEVVSNIVPEKLCGLSKLPSSSSLLAMIGKNLPPAWHWMIIISQADSAGLSSCSVWFFAALRVHYHPELILMHRDNGWEKLELPEVVS